MEFVPRVALGIHHIVWFSEFVDVTLGLAEEGPTHRVDLGGSQGPDVGVSLLIGNDTSYTSQLSFIVGKGKGVLTKENTPNYLEGSIAHPLKFS